MRLARVFQLHRTYARAHVCVRHFLENTPKALDIIQNLLVEAGFTYKPKAVSATLTFP